MSLDQHFLVDTQVVEKLINAAQVSQRETVLDVGAGHGAITFEVAKHAAKVYAVEKDERLVRELRRKASEYSNVVVIKGNFLKLRLVDYDKIIANPPFSILEPLIMRHIRKPVTMSLLTPTGFAENLLSTRTALSFKSSLAFKAEHVAVFDGNVCNPPYPGRLSIILLTPVKKTIVQQAMTDFLRYGESKVRNALRNVLWQFTVKRDATELVELSSLEDHLLEKKVKRTNFEDLQLLIRFLSDALSDLQQRKNLRIESSS